MSAEHLQLRLADDADIGTVQQLYETALEAANRGDEIHIHCDDTTCFDVGALQLLRLLLAEVHTAQLQFASPQRAGVFNHWLEMVA